MKHYDARGFVNALDKERMRRGMLWKDVARETGITGATVSRIVSANRLMHTPKPSVDMFLLLCAWMHADPMEFLVG